MFPLDISIYEAGTDTIIQPNVGTSVVITCPVPEGFLQAKDKIKVVCLIDGKLNYLETKTVLIDGVYCVQFSANHFSPYAMIVYQDSIINSIPNPETSNNLSVIPIFIMNILFIFFTVPKKIHR